ncbi:glucose-1-phosphate adenylyltransferase subunit GlgD [Streptococcus sp. DD13]|uniref:glucose-1-phosphate adenylyltransferase subunit GlgD n=1 Tax=Streptococcus sp. DD13 TaxID=1777881 RepID=UPI000794918E|nr:glucose-1-phosphate adenylyltransferase subunit GlgD [Streptococcus sp. DD13]KXT78977.1 Glycogen biosynthesis protein GlgD, glucose-1-phosphate adenylyltransferase family [Streptococcus sp. DD13]
MLKNTLGIVNIEGTNVNFGKVMSHRAAQSFSFLARYRLIDFVLSNMSNSGISEYQVYMPANSRSTIQHVGTGQHYNINSKRGKLRLLHSELDSSPIYQHDVRAFTDNLRYIEDSNKEFVLIAPSYFIYSQDYTELQEDHERTGADITVLYKNVNNARENFIGCSTIVFGDDKRIVNFQENHGKYKNRPVSLEAYFMRRETFIGLIKRANQVSSLYWLKDILHDVVNEYKIYGYAHRDYVACINNEETYFNTQLELIDAKQRKLLFKPNWPIFTRTGDSSPTLYGPLSEVRGSLLANGSIINGHIENSVIDRDVVVEDGVTIKNSIILNRVHIRTGAYIENAIIDKSTDIKHAVEIIGKDNKPVYIRSNSII